MKVQPELPGNYLVGGAQRVALASLLDQRQVNLVMLAAEDVPAHLDVAVGRHVDGAGRRRLAQRNAQRPATQDIPVLNARARLQPDDRLESELR